MIRWWKVWLTRHAQSPLHARYLASLRQQDFFVHVARLVILLLVIGSWELAAQKGWIDPFLFSSPVRVWELFLTLTSDGQLYRDVGFTVFETVVGFLLGTGAGISLASLVWASKLFARILDPYLVVLNSMPKVALGPLFIVTMGAGFGSLIAMAVAITVIITTLVVYTAFQNVDSDYIKLAQTFGANRWQRFTKIIFPACLPQMMAALKVNVGLAWVGVIVGEFLVAKNGLGHLIIYGFQVFNLDLVLLSLVLVAVCATIMYQLVHFLEQQLLKYRHIDS